MVFLRATYSVGQIIKMRSEVVFVSSNDNKFKEVKEILKDTDINLVRKSHDLLEIQGDIEEISKHKCLEAAKLLNCPVLVEDTSLCFNAFGGLPGPYVKWFLSQLGPDGLFKLLSSFEDKTAVAVCTFAYCSDPSIPQVEIFQGKVNGSIVEPRGPKTFGWDPCFLPEGHTMTYAEMDKSIKNNISHRSKALEALKEYFKSH